MKFKRGSADWNEMIKAISTAVEVPENQLTLHYVGRDRLERAKLMAMFKINKVEKDIM